MNQVNLLRETLKPHLGWHKTQLPVLVFNRSNQSKNNKLSPASKNSNSDERMDLVDQFQKNFPDTQVAYVCGDREFIGIQWLTYLLIDPLIPFRLRIRKSDKIWDGTKMLPASIIFSHLQPGQTEVLSSRRWVWGRLVYVTGLRLDDGDLLVIISSISPQTIICDYANRWGIETLLGIFKTREFCLESTHITDSKRLRKLLALMSLALCWAVKTGAWLHEHQPLKLKKHGRISQIIFRYGLDYLRSILINLNLKNNEFLHFLKFLFCT